MSSFLCATSRALCFTHVHPAHQSSSSYKLTTVCLFLYSRTTPYENVYKTAVPPVLSDVICNQSQNNYLAFMRPICMQMHGDKNTLDCVVKLFSWEAKRSRNCNLKNINLAAIWRHSQAFCVANAAYAKHWFLEIMTWASKLKFLYILYARQSG